jgi:hypothetical protein
MTSDVIRTFDTITDLHEVLTEIRGEPAVNRTTTCKQRFGFGFNTPQCFTAQKAQ